MLKCNCFINTAQIEIGLSYSFYVSFRQTLCSRVRLVGLEPLRVTPETPKGRLSTLAKGYLAHLDDT